MTTIRTFLEDGDVPTANERPEEQERRRGNSLYRGHDVDCVSKSTFQEASTLVHGEVGGGVVDDEVEVLGEVRDAPSGTAPLDVRDARAAGLASVFLVFVASSASSFANDSRH